MTSKATAAELREFARGHGWEDDYCRHDLLTGQAIPRTDEQVQRWIDGKE